MKALTAIALLAIAVSTASAACTTIKSATATAKFARALPQLPIFKPSKFKHGKTFFKVHARQIEQDFGLQCVDNADAVLTKTYAFGSQHTGFAYPGPMFSVKPFEPVSVQWMNELPAQPLFAPPSWANDMVDCGVNANDCQNPAVRFVVHLHGGHSAADSDGHAEAWWSNTSPLRGRLFSSTIYNYTNDQRSTLLLYHDHALGITAMNVYGGLASGYLIQDYNKERRLMPWLPPSAYQVPLILSDRNFQPNGQLAFPSPFPAELLGDYILVNGMAWPKLDVQNKLYRFRVANNAIARSFRLSLKIESSSTNLAFTQIGNDGGFLPKVVVLNDLFMGPAERADLLIDFCGLPNNALVTMQNSAPDFGGNPPDPATTGLVMRFKVTSSRPCKPANLPPPTQSLPVSIPTFPTVNKERSLVLVEDMMVLNGVPTPMPKLTANLPPPLGSPTGHGYSEYAVTEVIQLGDVEQWELINTTPDIHPMHVHLVQFEVVGRRQLVNFRKDDFLANLGSSPFAYTDDPNTPLLPAEPNERGTKDTVNAYPGTVTYIRAKFDRCGEYLWHCHINTHEDRDMMRPFQVVDMTGANRCRIDDHDDDDDDHHHHHGHDDHDDD